MNRARRAALVAAVACLSGCQYVTKIFNPPKYLAEQARELEAEEKYAEAVALYEQIIQKHPKRKKYVLEALNRAAAIYEERLNNWQKAAIYLQELRARTEGKKPYPSVMIRLARVLEHSGSPYTDALATYGDICKNCATAPEALTALLSRGRLHEAMQSWPQAKSVYEDAIQKLGTAPQAGAVRARLQAVWLMESLSVYASGRVHEGAALAADALKKPIDVAEVRGGLEGLDRQYRNAQQLWKANAFAVIVEDFKLEDQVDEAHFPVKAVRNTTHSTPDGWTVEFNEKRKSFALKGKAWAYKSPPESQVLGFWWSQDGAKLGWIGKSRAGRKRTLNVVDVTKKKSWSAISDPSGKLLGETLLFLPYCDKMVFPYEDYLAFSDLRGGMRSALRVKGDRKRSFAGERVEWIASSVDGLELAVAVAQPPPKPAKKGAAPPAEPPPHAIWKLSLGVLQE